MVGLHILRATCFICGYLETTLKMPSGISDIYFFTCFAASLLHLAMCSRQNCWDKIFLLPALGPRELFPECWERTFCYFQREGSPCLFSDSLLMFRPFGLSASG